MSELQFPKNPIVGQEYDFAPYKYYWDGTKWKTKGIGYNPVNDLREEVLSKLDITNTYAVEALRRSYAEAGYEVVVGSFGAGGVLESSTDVLLNEDDGKGYVWTGAFPKVVAAGTNPAAIAGFVMRGDAGLRVELAEDRGASLSGYYGDTVESALDKRSLAFKSLADLKTASRIVTGYPAIIVSQSSSNNFGADSYVIKSAANYGATPDGYLDHQLNDGRVAVRMDNIVYADQLGIRPGDLTQNLRDGILAAFAKGKDVLIKPNHSFALQGLTIPSGRQLLGMGSSRLVPLSNSEPMIIQQGERSLVRGIRFDVNGLSGASLDFCPIRVESAAYSAVEFCEFYGSFGTHLNLQNAYHFDVHRNRHVGSTTYQLYMTLGTSIDIWRNYYESPSDSCTDVIFGLNSPSVWIHKNYIAGDYAAPMKANGITLYNPLPGSPPTFTPWIGYNDIDSIQGHGIKVDGYFHAKVQKNWVSACRVVLGQTRRGTANIILRNSNGSATDQNSCYAGNDGIRVEQSQWCTLNGDLCEHNENAGVYIPDGFSKYNTITGLRSGNLTGLPPEGFMQKYGILIDVDAVAAKTIVSSSVLFGNTVLNIAWPTLAPIQAANITTE